MQGFKNLLGKVKIFFELFFRSDKKITYAIKRPELNIIDGKYYAAIHYQIVGSRVMRSAYADKLMEKNGLFSLFSPQDAEVIITLGTATLLINMNSQEKMVDKLIKYTATIRNNYME